MTNQKQPQHQLLAQPISTDWKQSPEHPDEGEPAELQPATGSEMETENRQAE